MRKIKLVSIIDDDKTFRFTTKKILEATESIEEIIQFADGAQAFEYFVTHKDNPDRTPDLVFLDINMPFMDAWEFLTELSEHSFKKKKITIYVCTSSSISYDREMLLSYSSLSGYLVKPLLKKNMFRLLDLQLSD